MKLSKKQSLNEEFYSSIGKLFYAVAASDKVVRAEEIRTLKELVKEKWVPVDNATDEYGTDEAYKPDGSLIHNSKKNLKKYETWKP